MGTDARWDRLVPFGRDQEIRPTSQVFVQEPRLLGAQPINHLCRTLLMPLSLGRLMILLGRAGAGIGLIWLIWDLWLELTSQHGPRPDNRDWLLDLVIVSSILAFVGAKVQDKADRD
jgi:hypothetical protein